MCKVACCVSDMRGSWFLICGLEKKKKSAYQASASAFGLTDYLAYTVLPYSSVEAIYNPQDLAYFSLYNLLISATLLSLQLPFDDSYLYYCTKYLFVGTSTLHHWEKGGRLGGY